MVRIRSSCKSPNTVSTGELIPSFLGGKDPFGYAMETQGI